MNENSYECPFNLTTNDYDMGTTIGITPSDYTRSADINISAVSGCNVEGDDSTFDDAIAYYCDLLYDDYRERHGAYQNSISNEEANICNVDLKRFNTMSIADAAHEYHDLGLVVTPLTVGTKIAFTKEWNSSTYKPDAHKIWKEKTKYNIGGVLGRCNLCTVDIDNLEAFKILIAGISEELKKKSGVDELFITSQTAGIKSGNKGHAKLVFSVPEGVSLIHRDIKWNKSPEELASEGKKSGVKCVFELRGGLDNYDVLPPSIHPETKQAYQWIGTDNGCTIAEMPADLLFLWENWDYFAPLMKQLDPNYKEVVKQEVEKPMAKFSASQNRGKYTGRSFISEWNEHQSIDSLLTRYGYTYCGNRLYARPDSVKKNWDTHVNYFNNMETFYAYSDNDYFNDGHQHTAFDLIMHFEFDDDFRETVQYVKKQMGIGSGK